eukprot:GEMP01020052.1.p1 GENE.GEMP01020052.1~~GEMP01020052.1.p1  ORF type:complete len:450 (+),score=111.59 GEMP01020052.1:169-1518(+)
MSDPMDMSLDALCHQYQEQEAPNHSRQRSDSRSTSRGRSTAQRRSTKHNGNDRMGAQFRTALDRARGRAQDEWRGSWRSNNTWNGNGNDNNSERNHNGNRHKRQSRGESRLSYGSVDAPLSAKRIKTLENKQDSRDIGDLPKHLIALSRDLAHFLRHCAGTEEYPSLSPQGWMAVRILRTMRFRTLHHISDEDIHKVVQESFSKQKPRFQLRTNEGELEIRALHNHSINVVVSNPSPSENNNNRVVLIPAQGRMPPPTFPPPRFIQQQNITSTTSIADRVNGTLLPRTKQEIDDSRKNSAAAHSTHRNSLTAQSVASSAQPTASTSAPTTTVSYTGEPTTAPTTTSPVVDLDVEDAFDALPPAPPPGTPMQVVAAFDGVDEKGEAYPWKCLKIKEDDILEFLEMDDRWAKGRHGREEGWYPTVFAEAFQTRPRVPPSLSPRHADATPSG